MDVMETFYPGVQIEEDLVKELESLVKPEAEDKQMHFIAHLLLVSLLISWHWLALALKPHECSCCCSGQPSGSCRFTQRSPSKLLPWLLQGFSPSRGEDFQKVAAGVLWQLMASAYVYPRIEPGPNALQSFVVRYQDFRRSCLLQATTLRPLITRYNDNGGQIMDEAAAEISATSHASTL